MARGHLVFALSVLPSFRHSVPSKFVFSTPPTSLHGFEWNLVQMLYRGETIYRLTVYRGTEASVRFTVQGRLETVRQRFASVFIWKKYLASIDIDRFVYKSAGSKQLCTIKKWHIWVQVTFKTPIWDSYAVCTVRPVSWRYLYSKTTGYGVRSEESPNFLQCKFIVKRS